MLDAQPSVTGSRPEAATGAAMAGGGARASRALTGRGVIGSQGVAVWNRADPHGEPGGVVRRSFELDYGFFR